jgi:hypothetical protein
MTTIDPASTAGKAGAKLPLHGEEPAWASQPATPSEGEGAAS